MFLDGLISFPKTLHRTESPISGKIRVVQKGRERKLLVNGVCQSVNWDAPRIEKRVWGRMVGGVAARPWRAQKEAGQGPAATGELATACANSSCLILGLGAGTIAHLLAQRFPGIGIDGVELDPEIIEVGKRFFDLDKIPNLNVICADAVRVVANPALCVMRYAVYGLVVVDLYCGGKFPEQFECGEFLLGVKNFLEPQGVAIFNRIFRRGRKDELDGFIEKIERVFGKIKLVEVPGPGGFANLLIVSFKHKNIQT